MLNVDGGSGEQPASVLPEVDSAEQPKETVDEVEGGETRTTEQPERDSGTPSFYDVKQLEKDLEGAAPEVKMILQEKLKGMQAAFTKAMQSVPKKFRDPDTLKSVQDKAKQWEDVEKDPELAKVLEDYRSGRLTRSARNNREEETNDATNARREEISQPKKELDLKDLVGLIPDKSEEDEQFTNRYFPVWNKMIDAKLEKALTPIVNDYFADKTARTDKELQESHPHIDVASFKADMDEYLKTHPGASRNTAFKEVAWEDVMGGYKSLVLEQDKTKKAVQDKPKAHVSGSKPINEKAKSTDQMSATELRAFLATQGAVEE